MYSFKNDYSELAHPRILELLNKYAIEQNSGYGHDEHTKRAIEYIKRHFTKDVDVHLLIGTSTNKIVISHALDHMKRLFLWKRGHINVLKWSNRSYWT